MHIVINRISKLIKYNKHFRNYCQTNKNNLKPPWNVLFFGTDEFSVASLATLCSEYKNGNLLNNLEVVTSLKSKKNPVEKFAAKEKLVLHNWPINLSECTGFHVGLVVSFGHLIPEYIINSFPLAMLNVHASLLPRWRGAAPIIYAIANGDEKTGITIMTIKPHKFDIGKIVEQAHVEIPQHCKMPELYSILANLGAKVLIKVLRELPSNLNNAKSQSTHSVTLAPRVNSQMAHVEWNKMSAQYVYNLNRALTGLYQLTTTFNGIPVKLYNIAQCNNSKESSQNEDVTPGLVEYCKESKLLKIQCVDGNWINVEKIGVPGKQVMCATDFNNGFLSKQILQLRIFR